MILLGWQHHAFRYYRRGLVHTRNCSSFLVLGISFCCLLSLFETPISINKLVFLLGYICQKYLLIPVGIEITRWELVFQVDNRGKIEGRERNIVQATPLQTNLFVRTSVIIDACKLSMTHITISYMKVSSLDAYRSSEQMFYLLLQVSPDQCGCIYITETSLICH